MSNHHAFVWPSVHFLRAPEGRTKRTRHLLPKKSWNVYNPANIARVKADEAAAAAREAAEEKRRQDLDAARQSAVLRGITPPPLPEEQPDDEAVPQRKLQSSELTRGPKRLRLPGEDDTDRDIRLARASIATREEDRPTLKLHKPGSDAPLTDEAGNISLFPEAAKAARRRDKLAEIGAGVETGKVSRDEGTEELSGHRFAYGARKPGADPPWYTSLPKAPAHDQAEMGGRPVDLSGFSTTDVFGREDPRRAHRQLSRLEAADPLQLIKKGLDELEAYEEKKEKRARQRERALREQRAALEREDRRERHHKRKRHDEDDAAREETRHRSERRSRHHDRDAREHHSRSGHRGDEPEQRSAPSARYPHRRSRTPEDAYARRPSYQSEPRRRVRSPSPHRKHGHRASCPGERRRHRSRERSPRESHRRSGHSPTRHRGSRDSGGGAHGPGAFL